MNFAGGARRGPSKGLCSPFFFQIADNGTGLSTSVVDAIENAAEVPIDVSARATDIVDAGETVDAVAAFLDYLETRTSAAPGLTCTTGFSTIDRPGIDSDSVADTFQRVRPGQPVCFDIVPKMNTTVMPTLDPQLFRARVDVLGDGFTPLDTASSSSWSRPGSPTRTSSGPGDRPRTDAAWPHGATPAGQSTGTRAAHGAAASSS